jgi:REP element-mobilizing transposase RayT
MQGKPGDDAQRDVVARAAHLARLQNVWVKNPVYFITTCVQGRVPVLADERAHAILLAEWRDADARHGWRVGRYVVMPDHVHFFCMPGPTAKPLSEFMQAWKTWTSRRLLAQMDRPPPLWQPRFFDHVLRSRDSYGEKWSYVAANPVRAGLVERAEAWPHAGWVHFDLPV